MLKNIRDDFFAEVYIAAIFLIHPSLATILLSTMRSNDGARRSFAGDQKISLVQRDEGLKREEHPPLLNFPSVLSPT